MLTLRRGHLAAQQLTEPLSLTMAQIDGTLLGSAPPSCGAMQEELSSETLALPDPFGENVTPWLAAAAEFGWQSCDAGARRRAQGMRASTAMIIIMRYCNGI